MSHTYTKLLYHCVFSTKGRRALIAKPVRERLYPYFGGILRPRDARSIAPGGFGEPAARGTGTAAPDGISCDTVGAREAQTGA